MGTYVRQSKIRRIIIGEQIAERSTRGQSRSISKAETYTFTSSEVKEFRKLEGLQDGLYNSFLDWGDLAFRFVDRKFAKIERIKREAFRTESPLVLTAKYFANGLPIVEGVEGLALYLDKLSSKDRKRIRSGAILPCLLVLGTEFDKEGDEDFEEEI